MAECAACGAPVDAATTYCDDCADRSTGSGTDRSRAAATTVAGRERRGDVVASPTERTVAALLAAAAVVGGFTTLESLSFLPESIGFVDALYAVGFLANVAIQLGLAVAFAVGAKRLADGTADATRYGRLLQALAVLSVVLTAVAVYAPFAVLRWLPTVLDPGAVVFNLAVREFASGQYALGATLVGVAGVGAVVSFAAGTALERT